jgi:hypothetical protein
MAMPAVPPTPAKKEKVVSLGVDVSQAPAATREQLKLPRGVGLTVDAVHADGPAKAAGIESHDVLEKLNDQWLVNPQQFYTLCRGMKAGDEVTLSLLHQGERKTIKAKLEEREQPVAAAFVEADWVAGHAGAAANPVTAERLFRDIAVDANGAVTPTPASRAGARGRNGVLFLRTVAGDTSSEWADDEFTITIKRNNNKVNNIKVVDKQTNKIIFNGKEDELDKQVRPNVIEKVKKAEEATANAAPPVKLEQVTPGQVEEVQIELPQPGAGGGGGGGFGGAGAADRAVVRNWVSGGGGGGFGGGGVAGNGIVLVAPGGPGGGGIAFNDGAIGIATTGRGKVMRWQDNDHVLFLRTLGRQPLYLLALSAKDGRVVYDGPVQSDDQRKSVPAEVSEEFEMLVAHPETAKEFGVTADTKKTDDKKADDTKKAEEKLLDRNRLVEPRAAGNIPAGGR